MKLTTRLPLVLAAVVAGVAAAGGTLAVRASTRSLTRQALETSQASVDAYASAVATHFADASLVMESTARHAALAGSPGTGARPYARALFGGAGVFEYVTVLSPEGSVVMVEPASLGRKAWAPRSLAYAAWYDEVAESGRTVVSDLHISPFTQHPTVVIATPARAAGAVAGLWAGALDLDTLSGIGRAAGPQGGPGGRYSFLTDSRGLVVAHQDKPDYVEHQSDFRAVPAVANALAGGRGAGRWVNPLEGEEKLGAWAPLADEGWAAVHSVPARVALAPARRLARTLAGGGAALAVLAAAAGAALTRRLVRPIGDLAAASEAVGAGDLGARVPVGGHGELADVASRFNAMVAALAAKQEEIRAHAQALERTNAELESFAAAVAHDLRTPLRAIDGFSRLVLDDYAGVLGEAGRDHLSRVRAATQHMGRLIEDLLGLSRVTRIELRRSRLDLSAMAAHIADALRSAAPGRDTRVVVAPGVTADADPDLATVALENLLSNAWKFTSRTPGATIEFGTSGPGVFFVRDDGAGFDIAYAAKLFGPFERLHSAKEFEGTGVGLATVARIVRRHGGWIEARAEPGRGATFTFTLSGGVPPPSSPDTIHPGAGAGPPDAPGSAPARVLVTS